MNSGSILRTAEAIAAAVTVAALDLGAQGLVIDHACTDIARIPASAVQQAKATLHIAYGHTSHGSQLITGMNGLVDFMNAKDDDAFPDNAFTFNSGGSGGALDLRDTPFSGASDLGNPNRTAWAAATRTYLAANPTVNVIVWSWCGQVDGSEADIDTYLTLMSGLEADYPGVRFVYMTGHLNGGGATGNVNVRNNQIRAYCRANNKALYDFADIESYDPDGLVNYMERLANDNCDYDSDGNGSRDRNWATDWQAAHPQGVDWYSCSAAHSQALNGNRKAFAAWWLWARLAGWAGPGAADTTPPSTPANVHTTTVDCTGVALAWDAATDAQSGVSGYRLYRDGVLLGQTAQITFADDTVAPSGSYAYTVVAVNGAGLASEPTAPLEVDTPADTEAPDVPSGLDGTRTSATSIGLSWEASADNVAVTGYRVYRDGEFLTATSDTECSDSGLTTGQTYTYAVSAIDAAGNESDLSSEVSVAVSPDPIGPGYPPPATLSATGLFQSVADLEPAASFFPYAHNLPSWADFATKRQWVALPASGTPIGYSPGGAWSFPEGTMWVQHFDLDTVCGDPASRVRVETRVLVRTAEGAFGLSYRWNAEQTEAALVPEEGAEAGLIVCDGGANRTQTWRFPGRAQCLECHSEAAGFAPGFNTRQLNRSFTYESGVQNQLTAMFAAGIIDTNPGSPASLAAAPQVTNTCVALESRARAWLDANCASCHQPGGATTAAFDARCATALGQTGLVGGVPHDNLGDGSMRLIAPDFPEHSAVAFRVHAQGETRMPPAGRGEVDPLGATLVSEWIHLLAQPAGTPEGQLANLSTRGIVQEGDSVMIGGFVISGETPKQVLIRGVGPALADYDVTDPLVDPQIELFRGATSLGSNDDWAESPDAAAIAAAADTAGAFPLDPAGTDAAMLVTLEPGVYSVHLRGPAGADAVGMVELYEIGVSAGSRLVNISTRLRLGTGQRVAIPGLVVTGETRRTFLLRAVGPGLEPFDVDDRLDNPRLTLMDGQTPIAANDDWGSSEGAAIALAAREVGAFALAAGSFDAALLVTLDPGIYTVVTEGDTSAEGVVLVEVYEVL